MAMTTTITSAATPATGDLPAIPSPVVTPNETVEPAADPELSRLMADYPLGSQWRFHGYHPAIWPRDWRRTAERSPWGMHAGDVLVVTGYGVACGFPDALLLHRLRDDVAAMLFPPEIDAPAAAGDQPRD